MVSVRLEFVGNVEEARFKVSVFSAPPLKVTSDGKAPEPSTRKLAPESTLKPPFVRT